MDPPLNHPRPMGITHTHTLPHTPTRAHPHTFFPPLNMLSVGILVLNTLLNLINFDLIGGVTIMERNKNGASIILLHIFFSSQEECIDFRSHK